jgi:hypothetical protein
MVKVNKTKSLLKTPQKEEQSMVNGRDAQVTISFDKKTSESFKRFTDALNQVTANLQRIERLQIANNLLLKKSTADLIKATKFSSDQGLT